MGSAPIIGKIIAQSNNANEPEQLQMGEEIESSMYLNPT